MSQVVEPAQSNMPIIDKGKLVEELMFTPYWRGFRFFIGRALLAAVLYIVLFSAVQPILALQFGGFANTPHVRDLTEATDFPAVGGALSLSLFYYFWLPHHLGRAITALQANKVFASGELIIEDNARQIFNSKWIPIIQCSLVLLMACIVVYWDWFSPFDTPEWYGELHPISYAVNLFFWMVAWIGMVGTVINIMLAVKLLSHIFRRNEIIVHRLHPDGSGGFNPLGKFALSLTYLALSVGVVLVIWTVYSIAESRIRQDYLLFLDVSAYLLVVPTLFYLPLRATHKAMLEFRNKLVLQTSVEYTDEEQMASVLNPEDEIDEIESKVRHMDTLKKLHEHRLKYPVWPFNARIGRTVAFNTLLPLVTTLVGLTLDVLG